ncbi:hypothetical protein BH10ACT2_BH10ACT2_19720 [soil metagenome]
MKFEPDKLRGKIPAVAVATIATLALIGCGSSTSSSASDGSTAAASDVDVVVQRGADQLEAQGYTVDRGCIKTIVSQFSPADLALTLAAFDDPQSPSPELSAEGNALEDELQTCLAATADPTLVAQVVDILVHSADGDQLDASCLSERLQTVPDQQLRAVVDDTFDQSDPKFSALTIVVFTCSPLGSEGSATTDPAAAATIDPCALLTDGEVSTIFGATAPGAESSLTTTYGAANQCEWSAPAGKSVFVIVAEQADVEAWGAETSGDVHVPDVGDVARTGYGSVTFSKGTTLVTVKVFPTFDTDISAIVTLAAAAAGRV